MNFFFNCRKLMILSTNIAASSRKQTPVKQSFADLLQNRCSFKCFSNFTEKHLCWSLFLIKMQATQVFSCKMWEISKNIFFHRATTVAASTNSIKVCVKSNTNNQFSWITIRYFLPKVFIFWISTKFSIRLW